MATVYIDMEAWEIVKRVKQNLARQLGVPVKHISTSMVIKHLYAEAAERQRL